MRMRLLMGMRLITGVVGASLATFGASGAELPAGPSRDLVARECQACHDLEMVLGAAGASREDWKGAIEEMSTYGMKVTPEEQAKILDYLATYLGPASKANAPPR
jgi:hypothetical protein